MKIFPAVFCFHEEENFATSRQTRNRAFSVEGMLNC